MYSQVISAAICGVDARRVVVEADVSAGMPVTVLTGYLASEVREAEDRVRTALKNIGLALPVKRITVNLAPADLRKEGSGYDLPIAVAMLIAAEVIEQRAAAGILFAGELGLDGRIEPVRGVIEMVTRAKDFGCHTCIIPTANLREGSAVGTVRVLGAGTLLEVVDYLRNGEPLATETVSIEDVMARQERESGKDFAQIRGQRALRRAAEVAVAGGHNLLIIGPPGSGKTMTAQRIPTILPRPTLEEALEITRIHSIAGTLPDEQGLLTVRPFRAPHHTISTAGMAGGGHNPRPGELSLAHRGVLYLDELPEFKTETLEILRQPMEDQQIVISRNFGHYTFPADFQLVASMNPCKCGYYPDRRRCRCTPYDVKRYLSHISQPLLDRIDICVEAEEMSFAELTGGGVHRQMAGRRYDERHDERQGETWDEGDNKGQDATHERANERRNGRWDTKQNERQDVSHEETPESSADIRERIVRARQKQAERYADETYSLNARMTSAGVERYCVLGWKEQDMMERIYRKMRLTARSYLKMLKVARTIADMAGSETINCGHLAEASGYRVIDKKYWEQ